MLHLCHHWSERSCFKAQESFHLAYDGRGCCIFRHYICSDGSKSQLIELISHDSDTMSKASPDVSNHSVVSSVIFEKGKENKYIERIIRKNVTLAFNTKAF